MSPRKLRSDEKTLWKHVTRNTERISHRSGAPLASSREQARLLHAGFYPLTDLDFSTKRAPPPSHTEKGQGADKKAITRVKRGKIAPEGKIDLHGLSAEQAHAALTRFILSSHARGRRLVLVVTGKGGGKERDDPMRSPRGLLKQKVPHWLALPPLGPVVLDVQDAHLRHGGAGACYVWLRRKRA